jgi:hypothetical protein
LDECGSGYNEVKKKTTALAGVVLGKKVVPIPPSELPFIYTHALVWLRPFAQTAELKRYRGAVASVTAIGRRFDHRDILGVSPRLLALLRLTVMPP